MRTDGRRNPRDMTPADPRTEPQPDPPLDLPGVLRALRRRADLSQRELADRAGTSAAQVARIESGATGDPHLTMVHRLVRAAGARLTALDLDGSEPAPLLTDVHRDGAGRRYPPHLDAARVPRWWGIWAKEVISFLRLRSARDQLRRARRGERSFHVFTEIRRLGAADVPALADLRRHAAALDLAGRRPAVVQALDDDGALRYLRDPSVRHWVAEVRTTAGPRIHGHVVAHVHSRHAAPPVLVVTDFGLLPEHRNGPLGPLLAEAVQAEAIRLAATDVWALTEHAATAQHLRRLGFTAYHLRGSRCGTRLRRRRP